MGVLIIRCCDVTESRWASSIRRFVWNRSAFIFKVNTTSTFHLPKRRGNHSLNDTASCPRIVELSATPQRRPRTSLGLTRSTSTRQRLTMARKCLLHPVTTERTLQFQQNALGGPFHGKVGPSMLLTITTRVLNMATNNRLLHTAHNSGLF